MAYQSVTKYQIPRALDNLKLKTVEADVEEYHKTRTSGVPELFI